MNSCRSRTGVAKRCFCPKARIFWLLAKRRHIGGGDTGATVSGLPSPKTKVGASVRNQPMPPDTFSTNTMALWPMQLRIEARTKRAASGLEHRHEGFTGDADGT